MTNFPPKYFNYKKPYFGPTQKKLGLYDKKGHTFASTNFYHIKKRSFRFLSELLSDDFPIELKQEGDKLFLVYYGDIKLPLTVTQLNKYYYRPDTIFHKFLQHSLLRPDDFSKWISKFIAEKKYEKVHYMHRLFLSYFDTMFKKMEPILKQTNPETVLLINLLYHKRDRENYFPIS